MRTLAFFLLIFNLQVNSPEPDLDLVRTLFVAAATEKKSADELVKMLSKVNDASSPVLISYKGVSQMMMAKYGINPISKMSNFRKGKKLIELAAEKAPGNLEVRYLRFAIQTQLPGFLNYDDSIKEDKNFLLSRVKTLNDKKLQKSIIDFLRQSKYCSVEEKRGLKL